MDDFDWDSIPSIDISGVGSTGSLPSVDWNVLNANTFDANSIDPSIWNNLIETQDSYLDFPSSVGELLTWNDILGTPGALDPWLGGGDRPGDFPSSVSELLTWNDILGNPEALAAFLGTTGDQPGDYETSGYVGDPTAPGVKEAVDKLLEYNANYATGTGSTSGTGAGAAGLASSLLGAIKDNPKLAAALAAALGGVAGLLGRPSNTVPKVGYQGTGSNLTASRTALTPAGEPGSGGGRRFMTDVKYAADGGLMSVVPGQPNQSVIFMAEGGKAEADLEEFLKEGMGANVGTVNKADFLVNRGVGPKDAFNGASQVPDNYAHGGLSDLGSYTHAKGGRMLKGPGDGMSDSIPATIEGKRPARLANDEFVVPADVVSHLGNGSSDAGAKVLYDMMAKVRKARTGNSKQGKEINPAKFLPK